MVFLTDPPAVLSADTIEVYDSCDVHDALSSTYENLVSVIEDFQQRGSGWILDKLIALDLHHLDFHPLRVTSYIPLLTCIQNRKAVINIKNEDEKCLLLSVIACLYGDSHAENHERLSHYLEYEKQLNLRSVQFPMALKDIPKLKRLNNVSLSVNTWGQEGFIIIIYYFKYDGLIQVKKEEVKLMSSQDVVKNFIQFSGIKILRFQFVIFNLQ